ncbi:HAD family hydrolase [Streptomyces sp. NA04227]|uniref:HAD family hydrolase n=1 Tax=Streptomyces sp. NA04227 TaxID=2742136 RepID=UPI001591807C|nr:HAD family hydrolase [Streptomyces sp. NA04227]QKW06822.1 HAD family hydrolase [Streptomyces sp. NA04227]
MGMKQAGHIVWDWNGTLFHDTDAVVGATNAAFAEVGIGPLTLERYRELYCVPVIRFQERMMGRRPTDDEFAAMDRVFHAQYTLNSAVCELAEGVEALLGEWSAAGHSQSILSMYPHDSLVPLVRKIGIDTHFLRVEGRTGSLMGGKSEQMVRHLAALAHIDPARTVVIGDAADDAVAAAHVGARAVLYTGGSHSRASLESVGVPVVDTLAEAVAEATRLAA